MGPFVRTKQNARFGGIRDREWEVSPVPMESLGIHINRRTGSIFEVPGKLHPAYLLQPGYIATVELSNPLSTLAHVKVEHFKTCSASGPANDDVPIVLVESLASDSGALANTALLDDIERAIGDLTERVELFGLSVLVPLIS